MINTQVFVRAFQFCLMLHYAVWAPRRAATLCRSSLAELASSVTHCSIHMLRVPRERMLAPSRSLSPATTWSSVLHRSRTVRVSSLSMFFIIHCDKVQLLWEPFSFPFPSLNGVCLRRPLLDGCFGAGSQLLQPLQADGQSRARGRHQHVFRVFPFPPPAAGQCAQWRGSFTVSNQLSRGPHKQTQSSFHIHLPSLL